MTSHYDSDFSADGDANQYLTFLLDEESYGLDLLAVQEIKGLNAITRMPNTAAHLRGVTNLRGQVIPILDLRARFNLTDRAYDKWTVFVIVTVESRVVGLVVDAVDDVVDIAPEAIQPTPDLAAARGPSFVRGIARVNDRLIALLDIERIIGSELASIAA